MWRKGPPPSVGWWPASAANVYGIFRWWDGVRWSAPATRLTCVTKLNRIAATPSTGNSTGICWAPRPQHWPEWSKT